jgi:hypothetical protein
MRSSRKVACELFLSFFQGVWFNRHRNIEGDWVPAARVPRTPCGRIAAFVALHGHGTYPMASEYARWRQCRRGLSG